MAPSDRLAGLRGIKRQPTRYSTDALLEWSSAGPNGSTRLPVVVTPATEDVDLNACARAQREAIDARLLQDGALLFRGFRIAGPAEFEQFAGAICDLIEYGERSSPRSLVQGRIYTSTEHPADQEIFLHNEQSYTLDWPMKILFWCVQPAMRDGRTPIADSRRVLARLSSFVVDKFTALGVLYVRNYGDGLGLPWQEVFQTTDRSAVEAHCRQAEIEFEWKDGERLRTRQRRPAVRTHPRTGERVWFNHAVFFHPSTLDRRTHESLARGLSESDLPFNTLYGDGTAIEPAVLDEIREAYRAETTRFDWQKGDVLLADNMLVAHGRERYEGPRRIAVAMGDRVAVA